MKKPTKNERGFIALISVIILTAILTVLIFTTSVAGFFARFDALGSEFKRVSLGLSEACSNAALLKIAEDYDYDITQDPDYDDTRDGVVVDVGGNTCLIKSVDYDPSGTTDM